METLSSAPPKTPSGVYARSPSRTRVQSTGLSVFSISPQNLKAVQKLLGHESIETTGDTFVDWDLEQFAASLE
jgi:hypothetical protein